MYEWMVTVVLSLVSVRSVPCAQLLGPSGRHAGAPGPAIGGATLVSEQPQYVWADWATMLQSHACGQAAPTGWPVQWHSPSKYFSISGQWASGLSVTAQAYGLLHTTHGRASAMQQ